MNESILLSKNGFLEIHIGSVKSGKTCSLYNFYINLKPQERVRCILYTFANKVTIDDNLMLPFIKINNVNNIMVHDIIKYVIIDRAHLFDKSIIDMVNSLLTRCNVILATNTHHNLETLICRSNILIKHFAYCYFCRNHNATLSLEYHTMVPSCEECYNNINNNSVKNYSNQKLVLSNDNIYNLRNAEIWMKRNIVYQKYINNIDIIVKNIDSIISYTINKDKLMFLTLYCKNLQNNKILLQINETKYKDILPYIIIKNV